MSNTSINPGFFLRYFVAPALALSVFAAPTSASASNLITAGARAPLAAFGTVELHGQVNINTATASQLELLPGIGPATAEKILAYRAKYPFKETLHLLRVKGVGRKTFAKIKPFLTVQGPSDLRSNKSQGAKN